MQKSKVTFLVSPRNRSKVATTYRLDFAVLPDTFWQMFLLLVSFMPDSSSQISPNISAHEPPSSLHSQRLRLHTLLTYKPHYKIEYYRLTEIHKVIDSSKYVLAIFKTHLNV